MAALRARGAAAGLRHGRLGQWQFGRLEDRKAENTVVRLNEERPPAPVEQVLTQDDGVAESDEWRVVTATGRYVAAGHRGGAVPDPRRGRRGRRRGPAGDRGRHRPAGRPGLAAHRQRGCPARGDPAAAPGEVAVTGYVRADGTGGSTRVDDGSTRAISSAAIGDALDRPVYRGFVELRSEDPAPATPLVPVELPELDNGPHFFYGLQWWFFGLLALVGFGYLAYDEWRGVRGPTPGPTPGPGTPPKPVSERAARRAARRAATEAGLAKARAEKAVRTGRSGRS